VYGNFPDYQEDKRKEGREGKIRISKEIIKEHGSGYVFFFMNVKRISRNLNPFRSNVIHTYKVLAIPVFHVHIGYTICCERYQ